MVRIFLILLIPIVVCNIKPANCFVFVYRYKLDYKNIYNHILLFSIVEGHALQQLASELHSLAAIIHYRLLNLYKLALVAVV